MTAFIFQANPDCVCFSGIDQTISIPLALPISVVIHFCSKRKTWPGLRAEKEMGSQPGNRLLLMVKNFQIKGFQRSQRAWSNRKIKNSGQVVSGMYHSQRKFQSVQVLATRMHFGFEAFHRRRSRVVNQNFYKRCFPWREHLFRGKVQPCLSIVTPGNLNFRMTGPCF